LQNNGISAYFVGSKFTNKNRVVDRVIRTIRDALGLEKQLILQPNIVQQIVSYYNDTPHTAFENKFTPTQVREDRELESWYIRKEQNKLLKIVRRQRDAGFHGYVPGNVLLIHKPTEKTRERFKKRRRNFDEFAIFKRYYNGNVVVETVNNHGVEIVLPIFFTRLVYDNIQDLPNRYLINNEGLRLDGYQDIRGNRPIV
jgi:hypothetical protein